ncbi:hypothetical protein ACLB2K_032555 [Fragaria x ananassa]
MASRCSLCHRHGESPEHIFLSCSFALSVWQCLAAMFQLGVHHGSLLDMLHEGLVHSRSPQLQAKVGVPCKPVEVNWHPPIFSWVKVNTDGVWRSSSGQVVYGGIFRDFKGGVLGLGFNMASSMAAEVMTVIKAIELT